MIRYWKIMCDNCGTVYNHQFINEDAQGLESLHNDGWVRYDGKDYCSDCEAEVA